jgi:putative transposase
MASDSIFERAAQGPTASSENSKRLVDIMARLPRFFAPGYPLHIIQRGNNRNAIFRGKPDYAFFIECLERAAALHGLAIHAYVLMTNHIHLLATPSDAMSAPNAMQSVGRRYVQYFNAAC